MTFEEWWEDAAGKSISVSLNAALRSIAAAAWDAAEKAAQPKWQSIEICPSDGRPVLVSAPGEEVCAAQWTKDGGESGWYPCGTILNYRGWIQFQPTHWMPLPPAPEKTK